LSQPSETGNVAFYIRKSSSEDATYLLDEEVSDTDVEDSFKCLLDANFVRDEIADGLSIVFDLDPTKTEQSYEHTIQPGEEDLWAVYLINCKASTLSMTVRTTSLLTYYYGNLSNSSI
jgi:hypothetical protein